MKKLWFLLLLVAAPVSALDWVSPTCSFVWDHSTPDVVQGYHFFLNGVQVGDTAEQTITCQTLGVTVGRHEAYVTAYNPSGESEASNTVPFVFTTAAPVAPIGVSVKP